MVRDLSQGSTGSGGSVWQVESEVVEFSRYVTKAEKRWAFVKGVETEGERVGDGSEGGKIMEGWVELEGVFE